MSEQKEGGFFSQLKNQIVTTLGLIITAAGGLVIANMEAIFGVNEPEVETVAQVEQKEEPTKDTLVIIKRSIHLKQLRFHPWKRKNLRKRSMTGNH